MTKKKRKWGRWVASGPAFTEGGQGRLYFVHDSAGEFRGEYVLKELKNPKRLDRFNAELQAIASLGEHSNIVSLIDSGIYRDPNKPCFVIPKADGTFADLIKDNSTSMEKRMSIFENICKGVTYLHNMSIIHRDLKPENILMFAGTPKITDMGLCLIAGVPRVTPSSEGVGPRFYMAPELEDGRQPNVGFEADVYSLGKVLYYALSGGKAFSREKHRHREWELSRLTGDSRMVLFDTVFDMSITIEPTKRYTHAGDLLKGFRKAFYKFRNHPLTTLLKKFQNIDLALQAPESELRSLSGEELKELLILAKKSRLSLSQNFLNVVCDSVDKKSLKNFAEAVLENESRLDPKFLAHASSRILSHHEFDGWFRLWLQPERLSRLAMHALSHMNNDILNSIARLNILILRNCEQVLTKLAENFSALHSDSKQNFLEASIKSAYGQKEQFLLKLSCGENLDNPILEAVVAGLCACGTSSTISRVNELAEGEDMQDRLEAISRGIVKGSSFDTAALLAQHTWSNPIIKILIEVMESSKETQDNDSKENDE